ncbi:MAG: right-handed parallel beta-helix repeat-containing protein [Prevotella sp.]|nr:right-handed parallel beta-helix repeat-containing protein [Prevotella sp.]
MKQILTLLLLLLCCHASAGEIVVREGGNIHEALRQAREWRRTGDARCEGGITIRLEAGRYYMQEPLFLRPEDSGTAESPTVIRGSRQTVICGDAQQRHTQRWPQTGMARLTDFNPAERTITIPTPPDSILNAKGLEMVVHQRWAIAILRVKTMQARGTHTVVTFEEPESRLEFEHPWPQPVIGGPKGNSSFLLRTTEQRDGAEQLVVADGANYVRFEGLVFEHTCWNRPLHKGHVTLQGGFPLIDAYKLTENEGLPWDSSLENQAWVERPVSAVTIRNACHIDFHDVLFRQLASTALDYADNVSDCTVSSCRFEHIGGTAIMAGSFAESPMEVHRPYTHLAERCQRINIHSNTIAHTSEEDWGAVAIALGYVRQCTVKSNDVRHTNYSGICIGWGWTPAYTGMEDNRIVDNKVYDYARQLYDAGGIYTLSNQPGSIISGNEIGQPYPAPYATNDRGFCIYLDARTDGFTIENNKTEGRMIRRDEIGDNHPGPNIIWRQ